MDTEALKKLIAACGGQKNLAAQLDVNQSTVARWVSSTLKPDAVTMREISRLCRLFDIKFSNVTEWIKVIFLPSNKVIFVSSNFSRPFPATLLELKDDILEALTLADKNVFENAEQISKITTKLKNTLGSDFYEIKGMPFTMQDPQLIEHDLKVFFQVEI